MRTSIHRGFSHPMGGVSPMKQEKDMVTASDGASVPSANLEDYENSLKQAKKDIAKEEVKKFYSKPLVNEDVLNVLPLSGEVVDAKNTVKDLIAGDYSGAALNASGFAIPFIPGSFVKGSVKKLMDYIRKQPGAKDAIKKGEKILKERGSTGPKPKGGVDGGLSDDAKKKLKANIDRYGQPEPVLYGKPKTKLEFNKIVQESTEGIGAMGRNIDNAGVTIKNLDPEKSVKKIGVSGSNQEIYEVTYPNGEKLKFWESTGSANKPVVFSSKNAHLNAKNSKGFFGVFPGNMDGSNVGFSKSWYIKTHGWERGYGSEVVEDTGIWLKSLKESGILK